MGAVEVAREHRDRQRVFARAGVDVARRRWRGLDRFALDESWDATRAGDRLFVTVSALQVAAAAGADGYVDEAVSSEGDADVEAEGLVDPPGFAGTASDGRSLEGLLFEPVIAAKVAVGAGASTERAFRVGENRLARIVATQIIDAGRTAVGVAIAVRPTITGYVRVLTPPSCSRCAVLAGRVYRFNEGFQRHPFCDCVHAPITGDVPQGVKTDPDAYFRSLSTADQDRYFTTAGARAIREGADIGRVVNTRRGMSAAGDLTTTAGATGVRTRRRLTPEGVYKVASDRDEAIRLLRSNGYLR